MHFSIEQNERRKKGSTFICGPHSANSSQSIFTRECMPTCPRAHSHPLNMWSTMHLPSIQILTKRKKRNFVGLNDERMWTNNRATNNRTRRSNEPDHSPLRAHRAIESTYLTLMELNATKRTNYRREREMQSTHTHPNQHRAHIDSSTRLRANK